MDFETEPFCTIDYNRLSSDEGFDDTLSGWVTMRFVDGEVVVILGTHVQREALLNA